MKLFILLKRWLRSMVM